MVERNLKVGDKVRILSSRSCPFIVGHTATVIANNAPDDVIPLIEFAFENAALHDGDKGDGRSCRRWLFGTETYEHVSNKAPSVASDLSLKPQSKTILRHLKKRKSISPAEALITYGISRLAACIYDIRKIGYDVIMQMRQDEQGHKYAHYSLTKVQ